MIFEVLKKEDERQVIELIDRVFNENTPDVEMNGSNYKFVVVKENNKVVATSLLTTLFDPIKNYKVMHIDYLCVEESYRGRGIGNYLFDSIEKHAREENINVLKLTSNPQRVTARKMYVSKGMRMIDTNLFIKDLI